MNNWVRLFISPYAYLFLFLFSFFCLPPELYAQPKTTPKTTTKTTAKTAEEIKKELLQKGFTEEILNLLTPRCLESLNRSVPKDIVWYATYDRDAKSVTVDFQPGVKSAHNTITVVSLKEGGCMTVQNNAMMSVGSCKIHKEWWMDQAKKKGIKLKIVEENEKHIYLSAEGNLGIKIFLYTAGNLCMEVSRNVEVIK
jgi:hypothetical protein